MGGDRERGTARRGVPQGRPRAEAWGGASPRRAGSAAARGIRLTQLAPAPQDPDPRGGEGGKRARTRVRTGAGRSGGPGSGQEGCERAANPAGGGRRARAPWGKNPGPGMGGGAVLRGMGGGSRRVQGWSPDKDTRQETRGPDAWVPKG